MSMRARRRAEYARFIVALRVSMARHQDGTWWVLGSQRAMTRRPYDIRGAR